MVTEAEWLSELKSLTQGCSATSFQWDEGDDEFDIPPMRYLRAIVQSPRYGENVLVIMGVSDNIIKIPPRYMVDKLMYAVKDAEEIRVATILVVDGH